MSRADAVFNVAHAALTVQAMTADPSLLAEALQRPAAQERAARPRATRSGRSFESVRGAGIAVCVSGAGPSLLAFPLDPQRVPDPGEDWLVLPLAVRASGFELERS